MNTPDSPSTVSSKTKDGVTYVPLAEVVKELGGTISWDNTAKKATLNVKGRNAEVDLNDRIVKVDGQEKMLAASPFVEEGRVYVTPDFLDQVGITHN